MGDYRDQNIRSDIMAQGNNKENFELPQDEVGGKAYQFHYSGGYCELSKSQYAGINNKKRFKVVK